jgi:DNA-binding transcriptional MerR regulator
MAKKYLRIAEVLEVCSVNADFVFYLEREDLIQPVVRRKEKLYPLDQVDRIRVAHVLIGEMGVNLEGVEVALHMREQIIGMRRRLTDLLQQLPVRSRRP